jgi:RNA polymerase sigma-B factor
LQLRRERSSLDSVKVESPLDRARTIERHLPLVRSIARRFAGRGEPLEDLIQIGNVALISAVDRCDREREERFVSYASAWIEGAIRRHLRDRCAPVRVPRHLHGDPALMALVRTPASLDGEAAAIASPQALDDVGVARVMVSAAARSLDRRERRILAMRYFLDLSQAEIGESVGISQVHVSRLLQEALRKMRVSLAEPAAPAAEPLPNGSVRG